MAATLTRRWFAATSTAAAFTRIVGANDRIHIGIIGTGGRGNSHLSEFAKNKEINADITAVCDVWRPNRERAARAVKDAWGAEPKATSRFEELLGWKDVDAVVIATPDFGHSRILEAAVHAGKDAYVEKPFGVELGEARAAFDAVRKSNRVVQVGTQWRSDGVYITAKNLIADGAIGRVTRAEFCAGFYEPRWARDYSNVVEPDVDWKRYLMHRPDRPFDARRFRQWQLFRDYTNGIPGLWMSHWANLVGWYLNDPFPASATAHGGVYLWKDGRETSDIFEAILEYKSGVFVTFEMRLTNSAGSRHRWYGDKGTIDLAAKTISGEGSTRADKPAGSRPIQPEPVTSHLRNFIDCMRSRETPRSDVTMGLGHAVAGIMAAESLETGRRVRFDRERLEIV